MFNNSPTLTIFCVIATLSFTLAGLVQHNPNLNHFSQYLFHNVEARNHTKNVIISPFSVELGIGMLCMGAKGATAKETARFAKQGNYYNNLLNRLNSIPGVTIANKLYYDEQLPVKRQYRHDLSNLFKSSIEAVDFLCEEETADSINEWVKTHTNGLISQLVQPSTFSEVTNLFLVNTITFKGLWENRLHESDTKFEKFYVKKYETILVPMMFLSAELEYQKHKNLNAVSVTIPYREGDISFVIFVPNTFDDFYNLENKIKDIKMSDIETGKYAYDTVDLYLPKFKTEFEIDLKDILKNMGLKKIFSDSADLSGIFESNGTPLHISKVIHKAVISVDENGTLAAGASGYAGGDRMYNFPVVIRADKPFIYFIKDKDNNVLFSGSYKGAKN